MMHREFEALANRTVTDEQYKAIEALYMASNLNKADFVKSIKKMLQSIPEQRREQIVTISTTDRSGYEKTPNGCYWHTIKAYLIDIDIRSGQRIVEEIPNSYEMTTTPPQFHYYEMNFRGKKSNYLFRDAI